MYYMGSRTRGGQTRWTHSLLQMRVQNQTVSLRDSSEERDVIQILFDKPFMGCV